MPVRFVALAAMLSLGACAAAPRADFTDVSPAPRALRAPAPTALPPATAVAAGTVTTATEAARRLYTVADTVLIRGAALCPGRLHRDIGMRVWRPPARAARRAAPAAAVFAIAHGGPAERAGLRPGDRILSVAGAPLPVRAAALKTYAAELRAALAAGGPVAIGYRRRGHDAVATLIPAAACDFGVVFAAAPDINAATDGRRIMVMRGMVDFLKSDDELALVVGHELSHNVLGHFARGRILAHMPFADRTASLRNFEREADYVGLYFVALSGYDAKAAIESARRMEALTPVVDAGADTHPSQAERYRALQATLREIAAKRAAGVPLRPNLPLGPAAVAGLHARM